MDNKKKNEATELTAQELETVSGGADFAYDPIEEIANQIGEPGFPYWQQKKPIVYSDKRVEHQTYESNTAD
ncbi:hypothetical protein IQ250_29615 [Pseudanabaenaceae cyanobacterium LEGE 13415]|nr:hypothetical protein [Pseudanabaenaceae cyanobacterium LEGE 13415]